MTEQDDAETPVSISPPDVSVVVPAFEEEGNLGELHRQLREVFVGLQVTWELLIVDDGSKDQTWPEIERLHASYDNVKGVRLSRNFGHQFALLAGLAHAGGRAVISMDADLQHPPSMIETLIQHWNQGYKVVQTLRRDHKEVARSKRWTSRFYYRLYSFLSGVRMPDGMADFRLLDRTVVDVLLALPEAGIFLRGVVAWLGFKTAYVPYEVQPRHAGRTKYRWSSMMNLAWQGISSFSIVPLRLGVLLGFLAGGLAVVELGYVVVVRVVSDEAAPGWASAVGLTSLLFAMLFLLLGVIGEYVGRILIEVRGRPRYVVIDGIGLTIDAPLDPVRTGIRHFISPGEIVSQKDLGGANQTS